MNQSPPMRPRRGRFTLPGSDQSPAGARRRAPAPPAGPPPARDRRERSQRRPPRERSVIELIQEIRSGTVDPGCLSAEDRQACVRHLGAEGLAVPEIAQVLRCSDRTITRDRKALQEAAAITPDPALAGRTAGQLIAEAGLCTDRIRRVTRDRDTPAAVKVDGERACFEILTKLVLSLQSLGYLPSAAHQIRAELTHHQGEPPEYTELAAEAGRIAGIAREYGLEGSPTLLLIEQIEDQSRRALMASQLSAADMALPAHGAGGGAA